MFKLYASELLSKALKLIILIAFCLVLISFSNIGKVSAVPSSGFVNKQSILTNRTVQSLYPWCTQAVYGQNPSIAEAKAEIDKLAIEFNIPAPIIYGMIAQESDWRQYDAPQGSAGNTLLGMDPNGVSCGIGISQITDYQLVIRFGADKLLSDWKYNLRAGVTILNENWTTALSLGYKIGNADRTYLEDWYYTLNTYHHGFDANNNGMGYIYADLIFNLICTNEYWDSPCPTKLPYSDARPMRIVPRPEPSHQWSNQPPIENYLALPFKSGESWCIWQGYGPAYSHNNYGGYYQGQYALDLVKGDMVNGFNQTTTKSAKVYSIINGTVKKLFVTRSDYGLGMVVEGNYNGKTVWVVYDHFAKRGYYNSSGVFVVYKESQAVSIGSQLGEGTVPAGGVYHFHIQMQEPRDGGEAIPFNEWGLQPITNYDPASSNGQYGYVNYFPTKCLTGNGSVNLIYPTPSQRINYDSISSITFNWTLDKKATGYEFQLGEGTIVSLANTVSKYNLKLAKIGYHGNIIWQVRPKYGTLKGDWAKGNFTLFSPLDKTDLALDCKPNGSCPVYRFWNYNTGTHIFTIDQNERKNLASMDWWKLEGIEFYSVGSNTLNSKPLYRYVNAATDGYYFSFDPNYLASGWVKQGLSMYVFSKSVTGAKPVYEYYSSTKKSYFYTLTQQTYAGFVYKKVAFYALPSDTCYEGICPVFRLWDRNMGNHLYTKSWTEMFGLVKSSELWAYEGVEFYAPTVQNERTKPVYRFRNSINNAHYYSVNKVVPSGSGWQYEGLIAFYAEVLPKSWNKAIYQYWGNITNSYFYTTNPTSPAPDWVDKSISFYAYSTYSPAITNNAPIIISVPVTEVLKGDQYNYIVRATDADNDLLMYSLTTKPSGMIIDSNSGLISWNTAAVALGYYSVTVNVTDGRNFANQSFSLQVKQKPPVVSTYPVYRFFNKTNGGHILTMSTSERDTLIGQSSTWTYEGVKYNAYKYTSGTCEMAGTKPVYRFFNTQNGGFLFTISEAEKNSVLTLSQFTYQGIVYCAYDYLYTGTKPTYRFFNKNNGVYVYATDETEKTTLINTRPDLQFEGVNAYVY